MGEEQLIYKVCYERRSDEDGSVIEVDSRLFFNRMIALTYASNPQYFREEPGTSITVKVYYADTFDWKVLENELV